MILEIKKYPDPILRKECKEVSKDELNSPELQKLINNLTETMEKNQGVGLAANQVGVLKKIIIVKNEKENLVLINPGILIKSKEKEIAEEGCLSFSGLYLKIKRAKEIEVKFLTKDGRETKIQSQGLFSRIIQHEIDHLDGILFIDHLSIFEKLKIKQELKKLFTKQ